MRKSLGNGWEVEEQVKDGYGKTINRYWFRGNLAIRHELAGPRAKHFAGYTLIRKDLHNIREWIGHVLELLKKIPPIPTTGQSVRRGDVGTNQIINGLLIAIIATYGKLFADVGARQVKLEKKIITDERMLLLHEKLIEWRNNYVAHSGKEKVERSVVYISIGSESAGAVNRRLGCDTEQPSSLNKQDYELVDSLACALLKYAESKRSDLLKKIMESEANNDAIISVVELNRKAGRKF